MKRVSLVFAALLCLGVSEAPDPAEIQHVLDARVAEVPGTGVIAVVIDHGVTTVYRSGVSGTSRPLDGETLFEIGSDTKTFTSTVLAEMVREGKVKLSDPVQMYLPSSVHVPARNGKAITLLDLATQHSGLPRIPDNMDPAAGNPYAHYGLDKLYAFLNAYKLTRDPGAAFEYSNLGVGLLGFALARANHMSYEEMVRAYVWRPLHMDGTAIVLDAAQRARFAQGFDDSGDPVPSWEFGEPMVGAGGIRSDITDMTKYLNAAMGNGPLGADLLFAEQPRSTFPGHHIGLVWWTDDANHAIEHGGDTAGFHAEVMVNDQRTRGVVLLSNGPAVADLAAHIVNPSEPVEKPAQTLALSNAQLDEYVGTYQDSTGRLKFSITRSGDQLDARLAGQPSARIYASSGDHFFYKVVSAYIEFIRKDGAVVGLFLTQNGQHYPAYKLDASGAPMTTSLAPSYPPIVSLDSATLAQYAGTYDLLGSAYVISVTGGHVFAQLGDQPQFEVYPSAKDAFFYEVADAQLTFQRDANGNVTGLTLVQNGRATAAPKKP